MIISVADRLKDVKAYYFVQKLNEIRQMVAEGKDVVSFAIGSPDMQPSEDTIQALCETAKADNTHGYQAYQGIPELRQELANWYQDTYGVTLDPNGDILPLMGSKEGILHLTLAYINEGDEILVPNPGYPTYTSLPKLLGASVKYYDLKEENNWYPDFEQLENIDYTNVKMLWVNYPHMPTGTPAKREVFEKLVDLAKRKNILICHDNPYSLVLNQAKPISILSIEGAEEVCLEFNSLSKSHNMAGWRVGMVVGHQEYITNLLRVKSNIDSGMFRGLQTAAVEALKNDEEWHGLRNDVYQKRRTIAFEILDLLGFEYSKKQVGMFVWAKPKPDSGINDVIEFIDNLLAEKNIFFTPGMIFGSNGEGYLRLSLCVPEERMKVALERIKK